MSVKIERLFEGCELGEGPHWDAATQSLYFVDIFGKQIHRYAPETKQHATATVGGHVSIIIPVEDQPNKFVISIECQLVVIDWDGVGDKIEIVEKLCEVDVNPELLGNRINDGKCDPSGRLWAGTMGDEPQYGHVKPKMGSFFSLTGRNNLKRHLTDIGISNGLAWNLDLKKFYYIDSPRGMLDEFDFDLDNGTITNRRPIFTPSKHGISGFLDGMAIDTDGNLWIAIFNGYKVIKIDPRQPETLLQSIDLPAKQVTSVAFGGPNLDELYVTSASFTVDGVVLPPPDHGALYRITGIGAKGYPGVNFKL